MTAQLLVDAPEFLHHLTQDLRQAQQSVWLQTLSFEGDRAGKTIASLLLDCAAPDIRILVDHFTNYKLSDQLLWLPWNRLKPRLRREWLETQSMYQQLQQSGVQLKFTRDQRSWFHSIFATNHKKTILIDDTICYVGGINLCDHNFHWHDLMFRFENQALCRFLKQDFNLTWQNKPPANSLVFENFSLYLFNGTNNEKQFEVIFELMNSARQALTIITPYLSWPFTELLVQISQRNVEVTVITPQANNYPLLRRFISSQLANSKIRLKYYTPRMSHMKAMLIDNKILVAGSSNFDLLSYRMLKEIILVIEQQELINDFRKRVLEHDLPFTQSAELPAGKQFFRSIEKSLDRLCVYFNARAKKAEQI